MCSSLSTLLFFCFCRFTFARAVMRASGSTPGLNQSVALQESLSQYHIQRVCQAPKQQCLSAAEIVRGARLAASSRLDSTMSCLTTALHETNQLKTTTQETHGSVGSEVKELQKFTRLTEAAVRLKQGAMDAALLWMKPRKERPVSADNRTVAWIIYGPSHGHPLHPSTNHYPTARHSTSEPVATNCSLTDHHTS